MPENFIEYFEYVKSLEFDEEPDYSYILDLFYEMLEELSLPEEDLEFDWIQLFIN